MASSNWTLVRPKQDLTVLEFPMDLCVGSHWVRLEFNKYIATSSNENIPTAK